MIRVFADSIGYCINYGYGFKHYINSEDSKNVYLNIKLALLDSHLEDGSSVLIDSTSDVYYNFMLNNNEVNIPEYYEILEIISKRGLTVQFNVIDEAKLGGLEVW